ncbi:MAG TPA: DUF4349 domain-containing protein [Ktedonobacterales bacterium]
MISTRQQHAGRRARWPLAVCAALALAALLALAGCGASNAGVQTSAPSNLAPHSLAGGTTASNGANGGATGSGPSVAATPAASGSGQGQQSLGPASYLIKTLAVDMSVPDPQRTASDLQQWILATDPHAVSAGANEQLQNDGTYVVQLSYSVETALYPQVEAYLAGYAAAHQGHLDLLNEQVQDVSSEYVDLQSRLLNLRTEQQRLLGLLKDSTNLSDTLSIEDRLTQVEGDIEQIEGRQNQLNGQLAFYTVTISLTPLSGAAKAPPAAPFSPGGILQGAWNAALVFGQWLLTALIWLAVFALYLVPVAVAVWLVRRVRRRQPRPRAPVPATP